MKTLSRGSAQDLLNDTSKKLSVSAPTIKWSTRAKRGWYRPPRSKRGEEARITYGPHIWTNDYGLFTDVLLHELAHHVQEMKYRALWAKERGHHGPSFCMALAEVVQAFYGKGEEWRYAWHFDYKTVCRYGERKGWTRLHYYSVYENRAEFLDLHNVWLKERDKGNG